MNVVSVTPPSATGRRPGKPPPLWFVTNGEVTVGPVSTNRLVRGVLHERVPSDCLVREWSSPAWRTVERVREVAALRRAQAHHGEVEVERATWQRPAFHEDPFAQLRLDLHRATDAGEAFTFCLMEAMAKTGACVGAVHRRRPPYIGLVTSSVSGPGMGCRLGAVLRSDDRVLALATAGRTLCEPPREWHPSGVVSDRLGALPSCSGVLMVPFRRFGSLHALMELGRPDHGFRAEDFQAAIMIAGLGSESLGNWVSSRLQ